MREDDKYYIPLSGVVVDVEIVGKDTFDIDIDVVFMVVKVMDVVVEVDIDVEVVFGVNPMVILEVMVDIGGVDDAMLPITSR